MVQPILTNQDSAIQGKSEIKVVIGLEGNHKSVALAEKMIARSKNNPKICIDINLKKQLHSHICFDIFMLHNKIGSS